MQTVDWEINTLMFLPKEHENIWKNKCNSFEKAQRCSYNVCLLITTVNPANTAELIETWSWVRVLAEATPDARGVRGDLGASPTPANGDAHA